MAEGERHTYTLPAGAAFGQRNPTCSSGARQVLAGMGDLQAQYHVGDVVQFPPMARAALQVWCRCAATVPCVLTSTTRWPTSP